MPPAYGTQESIIKVLHKKDKNVLSREHKVIFLGHTVVSFFISSFSVNYSHFRNVELMARQWHNHRLKVIS